MVVVTAVRSVVQVREPLTESFLQTSITKPSFTPRIRGSATFSHIRIQDFLRQKIWAMGGLQRCKSDIGTTDMAKAGNSYDQK